MPFPRRRAARPYPHLRLCRFLVLAGAFASLSVLPARADVKLPAIFGDYMVLQQEATLPVWGTADPGEKITVTFDGKKAETTAGSDGKWRADLPALPAAAPSGDLVIAGSNTITLHDVVVGDVWLCSGQSNMEFQLAGSHNAKEAVPQATDDQIRLFHVGHQLAIACRPDVSGSWQVCTPATARSFSAVGYFFGRNLRAVLHRPIGLIESSWGGTTAQAWSDLATLQASPILRHYADSFQEAAARVPGGDSAIAAKEPTADAAQRQWNDAARAAIAAGQPTPPRPPGLGVGPGVPTILFDGMIAPLIPFAIKGAIWYQGESNTGNAASAEYATLFPAMITGWRTLWKQGDFPFLFVQLANFTHPGDDWPRLREAQLKTLSLSKTGMAVIIDIGTGGNIHPPDKADVGYRLSLAARHVAYGENLVYTGPIYASMEIKGAGVVISFQPGSTGGGLAVGAAPWTDPHDVPVSRTDLQGFEIAGHDHHWFPAQAQIQGDTVVVGSPQVSAPAAVRYAWASDPRCNLYNKEGLPASPFRTDDWQDSPAPALPLSKK